VKGTGTIRADLTLGGTFAPGDITNFGNFTLNSTAVLDIELGGTAQGSEYSFIVVTNGLARLSGLLRVSFTNGFESSVENSDKFIVMMAGQGLSGLFTNCLSGQRLMTADGDGSFLVSYSNRSKDIELSDYESVPEASTWAMVAWGAGALLCNQVDAMARRRRCRKRNG
jgi:hypothetical protein